MSGHIVYPRNKNTLPIPMEWKGIIDREAVICDLSGWTDLNGWTDLSGWTFPSDCRTHCGNSDSTGFCSNGYSIGCGSIRFCSNDRHENG